MGRENLLAETGAGQHGVATATVAALFGFGCEIYMGEEDVRRQALNVYRMRLLGAEVVPVTSGSSTLKDAINEAFRVWMATAQTTYYLFGTAAGPHPYPTMVRDFQSVVGREAREQMLAHEGRLPDYLVACVGGGSNAIGLFHPFLEDDGADGGSGGGGSGAADGRARGLADGGQRGRAARGGEQDPAVTGGPDQEHALGGGGPRLPGRGAGARLSADPKAGPSMWR